MEVRKFFNAPAHNLYPSAAGLSQPAGVVGLAVAIGDAVTGDSVTGALVGVAEGCSVVGDPVFFVGLLVGDTVSSVGDSERSRTTPVAVLRAIGLSIAWLLLASTTLVIVTSYVWSA